MNKRLGKGLDALISAHQTDEQMLTTMVNINQIVPNRHQPRLTFNSKSVTSNKTELAELVDSIKEHGIIQPLSVRIIKNKKYELIAGERRLRAAKQAGLKKVPVYILQVNTDIKMMEMALIENLLRVNLNDIEEAKAYATLKAEYNLTDSQIAKKINKSRAHVTNKLRVLHHLNNRMQNALINKENNFSFGHAKVLVDIENKQQQIIFNKIIKNNLSVRDTEQLIKNYKNKFIKQKKSTKNIEHQKIEEQLLEFLDGAKTQIKISKNKKNGQIIIHFKNTNHFENIINRILNEK